MSRREPRGALLSALVIVSLSALMATAGHAQGSQRQHYAFAALALGPVVGGDYFNLITVHAAAGFGWFGAGGRRPGIEIEGAFLVQPENAGCVSEQPSCRANLPTVLSLGVTATERLLQLRPNVSVRVEAGASVGHWAEDGDSGIATPLHVGLRVVLGAKPGGVAIFARSLLVPKSNRGVAWIIPIGVRVGR
jgi:hypothetical protein